MDLNAIMGKLLAESKEGKESEEIKTAYINGCLDFYNEMRKAQE